ncbi:hypothetical protein IFM89_031127 [Coptis chinensis]|uniref:Uncharacterized protein n=1 Tax=Coptis chinensis TaxID=261450 RepID=A0A835IRN0_9MAGN|nr:hypothetical protein IFM89_031127 [Coptis chinensis]
MVSTSKRERWREFVAKREKEDLSPNVSSITDDYVDEYSDVEQKGLDDVENDQFLQQEEEEEAALQKGKLFVRKILNKRKNKEKITESNSWEDNSLCRFLGEAISVDEARRRWPFRYEKKDGKEEEVMIARRHFSQALVHGCVYNLYDDVHVQSLRLVMEYLRCYLHLEIHILGEMTLTRVVDWLALSSKRDEGIDLLKDKQALQHRIGDEFVREGDDLSWGQVLVARGADVAAAPSTKGETGSI